MGTWNALYFRGELPSDFRPEVEGKCGLRRLASWGELSLPGVDDGEASALALSRLVSGQVIWAMVQTTASVIGIAHFESGRALRHIEFADGSWRRVEGEPQPWEAWLFSDEELEEAKGVGDPEEDAELEAAFASKTLKVGQGLPWPREWETLRHALGVTDSEWRAARGTPPLAVVEGRRTSMVTHVARGALLLGAACVAGLFATKNGGFAGFGTIFLLIGLGASFVRRTRTDRWLL